MITFRQFFSILSEATRNKFTELSTTTDNKIDVINWENKNFKKAVGSRGEDEVVLGVVGNEEGLYRHIKQWEDLGFKQENMYIVDYDGAVVERLKQQARKLAGGIENEKTGMLSKIDDTGLDQRITEDNILDKAEQLVKEGKNLTHVDYDGTELITNLPLDAQLLADLNTVKTFAIVNTKRAAYEFADVIENRGNEMTEDELNLLKACEKIYNGIKKNIESKKRDSLASAFKRGALYMFFSYDDLANYYDQLKSLLKDFEISYDLYAGVQNTPMTSFIFSRNTKAFDEPEYTYSRFASDLFEGLYRFDTVELLYEYGNEMNEIVKVLKSMLERGDFASDNAEKIKKKIETLQSKIAKHNNMKLLIAKIKDLKAEDPPIDVRNYASNRFKKPITYAMLTSYFHQQNLQFKYFNILRDGNTDRIKSISRKSYTLKDGVAPTITNFILHSKPGDYLDLSSDKYKLTPPNLSTLIHTINRNSNTSLLPKMFDLETEIKNGAEVIARMTRNEGEDATLAKSRLDEIRKKNKKIAEWMRNSKRGQWFVPQETFTKRELNNIFTNSQQYNTKYATPLYAGMFDYEFDGDNLIKIQKKKDNFDPTEDYKIIPVGTIRPGRSPSKVAPSRGKREGTFINFLATATTGSEPFIPKRPISPSTINSFLTRAGIQTGRKLNRKMFKFEHDSSGKIIKVTKISDTPLPSFASLITTAKVGDVITLDQPKRLEILKRILNSTLSVYNAKNPTAPRLRMRMFALVQDPKNKEDVIAIRRVDAPAEEGDVKRRRGRPPKQRIVPEGITSIHFNGFNSLYNTLLMEL